jgi:hypothetical protein
MPKLEAMTKLVRNDPTVAQQIADAEAVINEAQEEEHERMPYRQKMHWMEGIFESKPIKFFVDGRLLATFSYNPRTKTFTSNNDDNKKCLQIKIDNDSVYLADYFYTAGNGVYECPMKPRTLDEHRRFLSKFLDFIAYAFHKPRVTLIDGSFKTTGSCTIPHSVFLVAGKQSFYERFGFHNDKQDRFDEAILITQQTVKDGVTFEDMANDILEQCANRQDRQDDINMIDQSFKADLRDRGGNMNFHKEAGHTPYRVCVKDGNVYRNVYIKDIRQSRRRRGRSRR